jgi:D-aminopeptidase
VQHDPDDDRPQINHVEVLDDETIDAVFSAAADATEEAIYNALCAAETMTGRRGRTIEALPLERVKRIMEKYT